MIGISWTEMLVIGVVALIFIGPKELPGLMQRIGKAVGAIRRMGSEFQRELNKSTGLDQVTDIRRSITDPLKKTTAEIAREFNRITPTGVEPSGVIKPAVPGAQSVGDEIKAAAGLATPAPAPSVAASVGSAAAGAVVAEEPAKTGAARPSRTRRKAEADAAPAAARVPRKRAAPSTLEATEAKPVRRRAPARPKPTDGAS